MRNTILVTGVLGYIGSHTILSLREQGYEPIIVDNLSNSHLKVHDALEKLAGKKAPFTKPITLIKGNWLPFLSNTARQL